MKKDKINKLPSFFKAVTDKELRDVNLTRKGQIEYVKDRRNLMMWRKINEIVEYINKEDKQKNKERNEILIEVSRMIEKRTGK